MQFKKKNSSHLRQGKAAGMNGNQQRRRRKHNRLQQQGAKPGTAGSSPGMPEGWRCCEQLALSPYHHILTPITPNRWAGFTHFLTFCPQGTVRLNTGYPGKGWRWRWGGSILPCWKQPQHHSCGSKPWGLSCTQKAGTRQVGIQVEFTSVSKLKNPRRVHLCEPTEKSKHFLRSFLLCTS